MEENEKAKVQEIEQKAEQIREDIAHAKATGVQEGSAEAKRIEQEVIDVKAEADRLSPEAFSDLQAVDDHRIQ